MLAAVQTSLVLIALDSLVELLLFSCTPQLRTCSHQMMQHQVPQLTHNIYNHVVCYRLFQLLFLCVCIGVQSVCTIMPCDGTLSGPGQWQTALSS